MATLSETYFQIDNTDWNYDHQQGHITINTSISSVSTHTSQTSHFKKANRYSKLAVLSATSVLDDVDPSVHKTWSFKHSHVPRSNFPPIRMVASMGRVTYISLQNSHLSPQQPSQIAFIGLSCFQIQPHSHRHYSSVRMILTNHTRIAYGH